MRYAALAIVALLLFSTMPSGGASAEPDEVWLKKPALKVGDEVLSRANFGHRLILAYGRRMVRSMILREQLLLALEAKGLTVTPAAVAEERKVAISDLQNQGHEFESFLKRAHVTEDIFDLDVWSTVASRVLAGKVGIHPAKVPGYLALNHPARGSEETEDPVFMRIGEKTITLRSIIERLLPLVNAQERNVLIERIRTAQAIQLALDGKIEEPTNEELKRLEDTARARILEASGGKHTLETVLRTRRQTLASWRRALRQGERIQRAIIGGTDEEELRAHFTKWRVFFEGRKVRVSHILVRCLQSASETETATARRRIDAIRVRLLAGEDFATVAQELSHDARSRMRGGDLGFLPRKSNLLDESFTAAAFSLDKGKISEVVRTPAGFHVMVVTDTRAGKPISFSRARAEVERDYADSRSKEWLADAKKGLTVEVLWEGLKVR